MTSDPRVSVAGTKADLDRAAAEMVADAVAATDGRFSMALSGGSTPRGLYQLLASDAYRDRIDWAKVMVFFADERCVSPDDPESNYGMVREALLSRVSIPAGNVHRMSGEACSAPNAAQEYEWQLTAACPFGEACEVPELDLILLGIGDDGHTASLFPDTEALGVMDRWVAANPVPQLSTARLTLTYPVLAAARRLVFLVAGASKSDIVRRVLADDPALPAARALRLNPNATLLLDSEAASGLV